MLRILFLSLFIGNFCFAQDTLFVEDGSIWWQRSSCEIDIRCYDNIDDLVAIHCSDSISITSIELIENVFEGTSQIFTGCRIEKLAEYLKENHNIEVGKIKSTSVRMNSEEMHQAIAEHNFRTIIVVFGTPSQPKDVEIAPEN